MGSDASLGVYVKNLGNRHYFTGGLAVGATVGDNIAVPGQPLTFGVELNYTF
jgi:iron complex outermembrane receptor protein